MQKIRDFEVDFLKKKFLGHSPQTSVLGEGFEPTAPLPRPYSLGAPALRASRSSLGTFGLHHLEAEERKSCTLKKLLGPALFPIDTQL